MCRWFDVKRKNESEHPYSFFSLLCFSRLCIYGDCMFTDYTLVFPLYFLQNSFPLPVFHCDWLQSQVKWNKHLGGLYMYYRQNHDLYYLCSTHRQALLPMIEHMHSSPEVMDSTWVNCADPIVLCGWLCYAPSDNDCALLWLWGSDLKEGALVKSEPGWT